MSSNSTNVGLDTVRVDSIRPYVAIIPSFGYRFIIDGDFDGDGNKEKLIEHFVSCRDMKEMNKFYQGLSYMDLVDSTIRRKPYSFVLADKGKIDTLSIGRLGQVLGLSYLKNEGDLNGDGGDEISYVGNWADWSSCNTWHIMTFRNKKWKELYSFPMREWQLPDLPGTFNQYGLFGLQDKVINTSNDSVNMMLEKQLAEFPGLVRNLGKNRIKVYFFNDEASLDSAIVKLR